MGLLPPREKAFQAITNEMRQKIEILYQDDTLLMIQKAPGLLSIPDRKVREKPNLQSMLEKDWGKIWVVHRLDLQTSGVICFARTAEAHRHLSMQFEHRSVGKKYLVLVDGILYEKTGKIDRGIAPHPTIAGKMIPSDKGKKALTLYQVKEELISKINMELELFNQLKKNDIPKLNQMVLDKKIELIQL